MKCDVREGDCLAVLKEMEDNSVDAVVTDPPYHLTSVSGRSNLQRDDANLQLPSNKGGGGTVSPYKCAATGFMGKQWDGGDIAQNPALWSEVLRVLKPGGHLAAFSGTRTYHRMACAIEDAGFEVRDQLAWVYGQGFPKSLDVSKAIDKAAGAEREVVGVREYAGGHIQRSSDDKLAPPIGTFVRTQDDRIETAPATAAARQWEGWGTALKPAWEPICLARKPLSEKTVAANVLRWGTGAINVDGCRVEGVKAQRGERLTALGRMNDDGWRPSPTQAADSLGRFPANLCHDGSDEVLDLFPESSVTGKRTAKSRAATVVSTAWLTDNHESTEYTDSGSAARFFYCAKASKGDRAGSKHPTVKPIKLMQWLCRLICPPGGVILDPFAGSGTTGAAAILEGFQPILIEREVEYVADIRRRLQSIEKENDKWLVLQPPSEARCPSPRSRDRAAATRSLIEPTLF